MGLHTDGGLCAEQAVRQALLYGFDRSAVVSSLLSRHAQAATLPIHPDSPLYDQDLAGELEFSYQTMEQRLEEARNLYDRGLITKEEYEANRAEILKDL